MGTNLHEFLAGGIGRQAWTQVHGQIHGQQRPCGLDRDRSERARPYATDPTITSTVMKFFAHPPAQSALLANGCR
jgi:hypothetical protein